MLGALVVTSFLSTWAITGESWFSVIVNGTEYSNNGQTTLPGAFNFQKDTNWVKLTLNGSASLKANQTYAGFDRFGEGRLTFKCTSSTAQSSGISRWFHGTLIKSATTSISLWNQHYYVTDLDGSANGFTVRDSVGTQSAQNLPFERSKDDNVSQKFIIASSPTIVQVGGTYVGYVQVPTGELFVKGQLGGNGGGGNMSAAHANSTASVKFFGTKLTLPDTGASTHTLDAWINQLEVSVADVNSSFEDTVTYLFEPGEIINLPLNEYPAGTYDIRFKAPRAVTVLHTLSIGSSPGPSVALVFLYGDLSGNNSISAAEVDYVQSQIGMTSSSGGWYSGIPTIVDGASLLPKMADINVDGAVTVADYDLVKDNIGVVGQ